MEETKVEETLDNPVEETPVEETPQEEPKENETPEPNAELEEKNRQLFERAKKAEAEAKALKAQVEKAKQTDNKPVDKQGLDVEDYIDISASLDGLDQKEKEYLAKMHKLTGESLSEIRKSEDFSFWQTSYKAKLEREIALNPSTRQPETTKEESFAEKLSKATLEEKEKLLAEKGLWKDPRASMRKDKIQLSRG